MAGDTPDVVVTAHMRNHGFNAWYMDVDRSRSSETVFKDYLPTNPTSMGFTPISGNANDDGVAASVNVDVPENSPHFAEALKAAQNLATNLARLGTLLNDLPVNQQIHWGNRTMTVGQAIGELSNTQFVISDQNTSGSGGVGSAVAGQGTNKNVDTLYYESFDGDDDAYVLQDGTTTTADYASPNYLNGEGMMAIILHELAHLSDAGFDFNSSSLANFRRETGSYNNFSNSEYWSNNEAFANDFANNLASAFEGDLGSQVSSVTSRMAGSDSWVEPSQIFNDHMFY